MVVLPVLQTALKLSERELAVVSKYRSQVNHIKFNLLPKSLSHLDDEVILQAYLSRGKKESQAVSLLRNHVKGRKKYPMYFPSRPSPYFTPELMDDGVIGYASQVRSRKRHHIIFTDWAKWNPNNKEDVLSYFYTLVSMNGAITRSHANNEEGVMTILDAGAIGFSHVKAATENLPELLAPLNVTTYYATMNITQQIVMNADSLFGMIWSIANKLAPKNVKDTTAFVSGDQELSKYLPSHVVRDKSYIPTKQDRILSRKMAEEWEEYSIKLYNQVMQ